MSKIWTDQEVEFLIENYSKYGMNYCADALNKTQPSIANKASRLGLRAPGLVVNRKTHEQYESELFELESDSFPIEQYNGSHTPIEHECPLGHTWRARPGDILQGKGCPFCAVSSFDVKKPGILYYVKLVKNNRTLYKIGITNRTVKERFKSESNMTITVLNEEYFEIGQDAKNKESQILKSYPRAKVHGFLKSKGNTELFEFDVLGFDN